MMLVLEEQRKLMIGDHLGESIGATLVSNITIKSKHLVNKQR